MRVLRTVAFVIVWSILFVTIVTVVTIITDHVAHASPLSCESIKDADRRHLCRALSRPQASECELIKDHDLRQSCRARSK